MEPIEVELSNGQKLDVMKRFISAYREQLADIEAELRTLLTSQQEAEFIKQYIGEQAEVTELLPDPEQLATLQRRREHIGKILERLDQYQPEQPQVQLRLQR